MHCICLGALQSAEYDSCLGENGINPVYISVKRRYETACLSKYISKLHRVGLVEEGYELLMNTYGNVAVETGKKTVHCVLR